MYLDQLHLATAISEDLLARLRDGDRFFSDGPRSHAIYDTTFTGCYRVEIDHGRDCRVAVEHIGGDLVFDWSMAEADRRRPPTKRKGWEGPSEPPTQDEGRYRAEVFKADREQGRMLLEMLQALDWGEPTPESNMGRDGIMLFGSLNTEDGARTWATWSPESDYEPAKNAFFRRLLDFAIGHASGSIRADLELIELL